jgi:hypothetical protein
MNHESLQPRIDIDKGSIIFLPDADKTRTHRNKLDTLRVAERNRILREEHNKLLQIERSQSENDDIIKTTVFHDVLRMQSELDFDTRVVDYYNNLADKRATAWEAGDPKAIHNLQIKITTLSKIAPLQISGLAAADTSKTWYNKNNMTEKFSQSTADHDWQAPRPTIGELPTPDYRGVHAKEVHSAPNTFGREAYLHNIKQQDADIANLAKTEIHKDLQNLDLDVYSRGLNKRIKSIENNMEDAPDSDIRELQLLREKQKEVNARLAIKPAAGVPKLDSQFARRQEIEKVRREATKIIDQIKSVTAERAKLSSWNPFNWSRIRDLDTHLDTLKSRKEEWQLRSKSNALQEKLFASKTPEYKINDEADLEELETG